MNPNVLPHKNIFRSLDRNKSTTKSTPTFTKKNTQKLKDSKTPEDFEDSQTKQLVKSKSSFFAGTDIESNILPKRNVSYNQMYKAITSAKNRDPQMSSELKRYQTKKNQVGPMINIDDPNSQRVSLLTP